ncbi:hypothetical protein KCU64_g5621, partial [Aureobasidium melanogenum]
MSHMDALIDEAMILGDREVRDLALEIRNHENEHQAARQTRLWNLGDKIDNIKRPYLTFSDIVTVVEAASDEEAQPQAVMARLAKRGEWDPLIAELAISTVGPQDTDTIVHFLNFSAIDKKDHITTACGKKLVECVACEEQLPPKDLILASCGHCYCGSCLSMVFNAAVSDESLYPPRCCAQMPIPIEHAKRFLDKEFEATFAKKGIEFSTVDRTYCSDPICSTFIPPDDYEADHAYCPKCWQRTCIVCKAPAQGGDCPTDLELAALLRYAEEMRWQRCYNCLSVVQRQHGCNHMECRCGQSFCYTCGRPIYVHLTTRCPCQDIQPSRYRFYRRDENSSQPPDSPRTIPEDEIQGPAVDWNLPVTAPIWIGVVEEDQDRSRAGTPDGPDLAALQAFNDAWDFNNGEQASIVDSRRSRTPDVETPQDVTPPGADATILPVTSNADLVNLLRQLAAIVSAQYPVLLNQDQENEGPAVPRSDSASNHLSLGSDGDSQHARSQTFSEDILVQERVSEVQLSDHFILGKEPTQSDHDDEDLPEYQNSEPSSFASKQSARHHRLRTRFSPHRLLRVLRKAGMSALRGKGHTSSCGD